MGAAIALFISCAAVPLLVPSRWCLKQSGQRYISHGIPAEVQAKMLDPFFTITPMGKGTGLGLAISHQIAPVLIPASFKMGQASPLCPAMPSTAAEPG